MKFFNVYLLYLGLKLLFLRAVLGSLLLYTRSSWNEVCKITMKLYTVVAVVYNNNHILLLTQLLSHVWLFETPWTAAGQPPLSSTISRSLLKFMSIELVMLSNHLILCHPLLLLSLTFPSNRVFSSGSSHQVAKVLELQLQHQSFQWIFRVDFLQDWLVWSPCSPRNSQESPPAPQFESISSLVLSLLHDPTLPSVYNYWKNPRFDYTDFVSQVMSLLFNMPSRFVTAFLPRSKHCLLSRLQSPSAVILAPKTIKSVTTSTFFSFYCHEVMDAMITGCWNLSFLF